MRVVAVTTCALLAAGQLAAQNRIIPLPDTLGANFNIADTATARGSATDFDFLDGTWHFRFQWRNPDGTFGEGFTGHWYSGKKVSEHYQQNGHDAQMVLVEDQWRPDDQLSSSASGTYTWRLFSSQRPLWAIQGVGIRDGATGEWNPGWAWGDATNRYLVQHNGSRIARIRYFNITQDGFLWRADISQDGGRTWMRDAWSMQASRIGR